MNSVMGKKKRKKQEDSEHRKQENATEKANAIVLFEFFEKQMTNTHQPLSSPFSFHHTLLQVYHTRSNSKSATSASRQIHTFFFQKHFSKTIIQSTFFFFSR